MMLDYDGGVRPSHMEMLLEGARLGMRAKLSREAPQFRTEQSLNTIMQTLSNDDNGSY